MAEARSAERRDRVLGRPEVVVGRAAPEELEAQAKHLRDPHPVDVVGEMEIGQVETVGEAAERRCEATSQRATSVSGRVWTKTADW